MKGKFMRKAVALGLVGAMAATSFTGCGSKKSAGDDNHFTMWIYQDDGAGTYYTDYSDAASVQYVEAQTWDTEKGGIGDGNSLDFDFIVPVKGSETDNFNTMLSTGDYPELIDLTASSENAEALVEEGVLMDITEYVEKYMPNYVAYLDANPELKLLCTSTDDAGKTHYYQICQLGDSVRNAWQGYMYRRDWIVQYATPSEYVWDWDSDAVKTNGHPAVTPLSEAKKANNLDGWKKNEVTSFTADYGNDPDNDYTDNVIFPSGTADPLTISDWEWMFEAFEKAFDERGWGDEAYDISISYMGNSTLGDLVSSFGGGNGFYYVNDGQVEYDGTSDNFKTYTDCMTNWYKKGWLDQQFQTRTDLFYMINTTGVSQGKVGIWSAYYGSTIGDTLQATCEDATDQKNAYAMAAPLPINDEYGTDAQKFQDPDCLYQDSRKAASFGVTSKCEDKDLETLFTFFDWTYTDEGSRVMNMGLTPEQVESVDFDPDLYAEYGYKGSYEVDKDDQGMTEYVALIPSDDAAGGAMTASRMCLGITYNGNTDTYKLVNDQPKVLKNAYELWAKYEDKGSASIYTGLLSAEDSATWSSTQTAVTDAMSQNLPQVIAGKMSWDDYKKAVEATDPSSVCPLLQKQIDKMK